MPYTIVTICLFVVENHTSDLLMCSDAKEAHFCTDNNMFDCLSDGNSTGNLLRVMSTTTYGVCPEAISTQQVVHGVHEMLSQCTMGLTLALLTLMHLADSDKELWSDETR